MTRSQREHDAAREELREAAAFYERNRDVVEHEDGGRRLIRWAARE